MTFHRALLAAHKLPGFQHWLERNDIPTRPGRGPYQVLQVLTPDAGWQVIFRKDSSPDHLTVNKKLEPLVRSFLKESRGVLEGDSTP